MQIGQTDFLAHALTSPQGSTAVDRPTRKGVKGNDNSNLGPLLEAIKKGDVKQVQALLKSLTPGQAGGVDDKGQTALHHAVVAPRESSLDIVKLLVEVGKLDVAAISKGWYDNMTRRTKDANSAYQLAVKTNNQPAADHLHQVMEKEYVQAVSKGDGKRADQLLAAGLKPLNAFFQLVRTGSLKDVEAYMEKTKDFDINAQDEVGSTALHHVIDSGRPDTDQLVGMLIHKGIDLAKKDEWGRSALQHAMHLQSTLGSRADDEVLSSAVSLLKNRMMTQLQDAVKKGDEARAQALRDAGAVTIEKPKAPGKYLDYYLDGGPKDPSGLAFWLQVAGNFESTTKVKDFSRKDILADPGKFRVEQRAKAVAELEMGKNLYIETLNRGDFNLAGWKMGHLINVYKPEAFYAEVDAAVKKLQSPEVEAYLSDRLGTSLQNIVQSKPELEVRVKSAFSEMQNAKGFDDMWGPPDYGSGIPQPKDPKEWLSQNMVGYATGMDLLNLALGSRGEVKDPVAMIDRRKSRRDGEIAKMIGDDFANPDRLKQMIESGMDPKVAVTELAGKIPLYSKFGEDVDWMGQRLATMMEKYGLERLDEDALKKSGLLNKDGSINEKLFTQILKEYGTGTDQKYIPDTMRVFQYAWNTARQAGYNNRGRWLVDIMRMEELSTKWGYMHNGEISKDQYGAWPKDDKFMPREIMQENGHPRELTAEDKKAYIADQWEYRQLQLRTKHKEDSSLWQMFKHGWLQNMSGLLGATTLISSALSDGQKSKEDIAALVGSGMLALEGFSNGAERRARIPVEEKKFKLIKTGQRPRLPNPLRGYDAWRNLGKAVLGGGGQTILGGALIPMGIKALESGEKAYAGLVFTAAGSSLASGAIQMVDGFSQASTWLKTLGKSGTPRPFIANAMRMASLSGIGFNVVATAAWLAMWIKDWVDWSKKQPKVEQAKDNIGKSVELVDPFGIDGHGFHYDYNDGTFKDPKEVTEDRPLGDDAAQGALNTFVVRWAEQFGHEGNKSAPTQERDLEDPYLRQPMKDYLVALMKDAYRLENWTAEDLATYARDKVDNDVYDRLVHHYKRGSGRGAGSKARENALSEWEDYFHSHTDSRGYGRLEIHGVVEEIAGEFGLGPGDRDLLDASMRDLGKLMADAFDNAENTADARRIGALASGEEWKRVSKLYFQVNGYKVGNQKDTKAMTDLMADIADTAVVIAKAQGKDRANRGDFVPPMWHERAAFWKSFASVNGLDDDLPYSRAPKF